MKPINFFLVLVFWGSCAWSKASLSPALQQSLSSSETSDIVIYLKTKADLKSAFAILDRTSRVAHVVEKLLDASESSQKPILQFLETRGFKARGFVSTNAIAVSKVPSNLVQRLSRFSAVRSIGLDVRSKLNLPFPFPESPEEEKKVIGIPSHLSRIKVDRVWNELKVRGEGIVIAGQDTGYFWKHKALQDKYRGFNQGFVDHNYNWHDGIVGAPCSPGGAEPCDDKDHGTHTMGSIVGDDGQGNQIGVAPGAQWIGCRNMQKGVGTVSSYLECFDFFLAPFPINGSVAKNGRPDLAPHILNNSWSCPKSEGCVGDEFLNVVQAYKAAGILLVAAAGNDGPSCGTASNQPASFAGDVLVVGAWNSYINEIAFFSGVGPSPFKKQLAPNVIAVGTGVKSSMASGPNDYDDKAGTSMASPQVAGVVALLWSYKPELIGQIDATLDVIQRTADPIRASQTCGAFSGGSIPNAVYGYGMVNAYRALTEKL